MFWLFNFIVYHITHFLLTAILTAYAGWFLADKIGINRFVGLAIGLLANIPGVLVLAIIWAVQSYSKQLTDS